jgi:hypothetical protein
MIHNIIKGLWLGDDEGVAEAKRRGYARLACCKDGIDSHRSMLGYDTLGAPKGGEYLSARRGNVMALNLIDHPDPDMIPDAAIDAGLKFIKEMQDKGQKVFVHCNAGHSRSPSITLMFLRAIGEMPHSLPTSERMFKTIYREYDPGTGMRAHTRARWEKLPNFFLR